MRCGSCDNFGKTVYNFFIGVGKNNPYLCKTCRSDSSSLTHPTPSQATTIPLPNDDVRALSKQIINLELLIRNLAAEVASLKDARPTVSPSPNVDVLKEVGDPETRRRNLIVTGLTDSANEDLLAVVNEMFWDIAVHLAAIILGNPRTRDRIVVA